ncbi:DEAD/DEAH box helicase [Parvibaculaceae bacterium PLY_AMNH_Bact1]|nr:DEAD/DEAH box helicase [Parvibaculaceae bacterium PLY_AMNH_Bact1]
MTADETGSEPKKTFDELGLGPKVLGAIGDAGYTHPTPIQAQAIPEALNGRDILGIAQTGTGKTASFTLPMIEKLGRGRARARMPRSLIVEPTRELAAQVSENFEVYGKNHKLTMALLIGGVSFGDQEKKLDRGVDVLIATPGRLLDHFERGKVLLTGVQTLVIDEADRMLDMGFIPDIERICKLIPGKRQTLFFSATMPPEITRLTKAFLKDPVRIEVAKAATTASTVTQKLITTHRLDKRDVLRDILKTEDVKNAIVFCNRKRDVGVLHRSLVKHGFSAGCLHGDLDQSTRMRTLDGFKKNEIQILVASDVAARGLDIPDVSHVVNFDVPSHAEDYVHRIGRTGRAGREGAAFMLATKEDGKYLAAIEKLINTKIDDDTPYGKKGKKPAEASKADTAKADAETSDAKEEAPKKPRRSRRKKTEDAPEAVAETAADTVEADAKASDDTKEDAPKPKRTRRKPAAKKTKAAAEPVQADEGSEADAKPMRGKKGQDPFGGHMPAFIARPIVRRAVSPEAEESEADEAEAVGA